MAVFPEQINRSTCNWISAIDLENVHFSIHADEDHEKPLPLVGKARNTSCFYISDINSLALCYNLVLRNLDHYSLAWHVTLVFHTDVITQVICEKQEVETTPDLLT